MVVWEMSQPVFASLFYHIFHTIRSIRLTSPTKSVSYGANATWSWSLCMKKRASKNCVCVMVRYISWSEKSGIREDMSLVKDSAQTQPASFCLPSQAIYQPKFYITSRASADSSSYPIFHVVYLIWYSTRNQGWV